jgi:adenylate cyclase
MKVNSSTTHSYKIITSVHPYIRDLDKYMDPGFYNKLSDPNFYTIQMKEMTIAFWDISGFSDFCKTLRIAPAAIIRFLEDYFTLASKVIHRHKGVVDKFLGDGIMANFDREMDAISAALELRGSFDKIVKKTIKICRNLKIQKEISLFIKCGIHRGEVVFGLLDTGERYEITSVGSTVNLASRLEDKAKDNQIIISEQMREKISLGKIDLRPIYLRKEVDKIKSYKDIRVIYEVTGSN